MCPSFIISFTPNQKNTSIKTIVSILITPSIKHHDQAITNQLQPNRLHIYIGLVITDLAQSLLSLYPKMSMAGTTTI